jgi:hypothetical protein
MATSRPPRSGPCTRRSPWFWVPAALTLLTAALLPGLAPGAAARRRRRMVYFGAMAGLVLVLAVTLVLLAL